jgi:hypothetical protein
MLTILRSRHFLLPSIAILALSLFLLALRLAVGVLVGDGADGGARLDGGADAAADRAPR